MDLYSQPHKSSRKIAGQDVAVVEAPRFIDRGFFGSFAAGVQSLARGMRITLAYLMKPSDIVTQQYPENRETLKMFDRYRARLHVVVDENDYHKCTACEACQTACPNDSIQVFPRKNAAGKDEIDHLLWRMDSCTFCNACVQACPWSAIAFTGEFESAVFDRRLLVYNIIPYAGPTAKDLAKIEDPAKRSELMEPRTAYSGAVPLQGAVLPGVPPLNLKEKESC
jgi:NADH-quinone oxidoreductase subunit I